MALTEIRKPETPKGADLDTADKDPTIARRRFLRWGIYAVGAGVAGVVGVPVVGYFIAPATTSEAASTVEQSLGKVADLAKVTTAPRKVDLTGIKYTDTFKEATIDKVYWVRALKPDASTPADFLVLDPTCSHAGCKVSFSRTENQYSCPCHGARYDLEGKNLQVAPRPLSKLTPTINAQGELVINVFQKLT